VLLPSASCGPYHFRNMKVGLGLVPQNYPDWDRYAADDWTSGPRLADAEVIEDSLWLARMADTIGLDSVWTVEHHFTPYIMVPNPIQLMSWVAAATSRVDVGTMVTVLPWHHPLRLAAEVSMLDILLGHRQLHLGMGRGTSPTEFDAFGIPRDTTRAKFTESLEVLKLALTEERFAFSGEHYTIPEVTTRPRPRSSRRLVDNMLMAWGSPESLPVAAHAGLKPLFIPQRGWGDYATEMRQFNTIRAEHGWAAANATAAVWTYCAPTRAEVEQHGGQYITEYADSSRRHYMLDNPEVFRSVKGYERYANRAEALARSIADGLDPREAALSTMTSIYVIGTPDEVLDQLEGICRALAVEHLILVCQFGTMPRGQAERSLRLIVEHVVPTLRQLQLAPVSEVTVSG
jgi:alkanesulfonate monooxygenase SsuD/methylene tetrahydromethanopterin reductase-like flavin-dependent oxidoreductase (luciferase family)